MGEAQKRIANCANNRSNAIEDVGCFGFGSTAEARHQASRIGVALPVDIVQQKQQQMRMAPRLFKRCGRRVEKQNSDNYLGKMLGAQGRNRTTDTAIFSRMLYQLSYLGMSRSRWYGPASRRVIVGPKGPVYSLRPASCGLAGGSG
jgi:hypothetical protein